MMVKCTKCPNTRSGVAAGKSRKIQRSATFRLPMTVWKNLPKLPEAVGTKHVVESGIKSEISSQSRHVHA